MISLTINGQPSHGVWQARRNFLSRTSPDRASAALRTSDSAVRGPAYVNPTAASLLDVYVDGTLVTALDGTPGHSVTVAPSADGTQTIANLPLYSTNSDVTAIEWAAGATKVLALGEAPPGAFTTSPGAITAITLTMQMNATGFALTGNSDGAAGTLLAGQTYAFGTAGTPALVYFYPTDPLGGYLAAVPTSGFGGLPAGVNVTTTTAAAGSKIGQQPLGGYAVSHVTTAGSVSVAVTASNPAWFVGDTTHYPQLNALYGVSPGLFASLGPARDVAQVTLVPLARTFTEWSVSSAPDLTVAGPDGALWFAETGGFIGRIATGGSLTEYAIPNTAWGIVAGPDGALWFTVPYNAAIGRIDTAGNIKEYSTGGGAPWTITVGPDNALWFTEPYQDQIVRMTTAGAMTRVRRDGVLGTVRDRIGPGRRALVQRERYEQDRADDHVRHGHRRVSDPDGEQQPRRHRRRSRRRAVVRRSERDQHRPHHDRRRRHRVCREQRSGANRSRPGQRAVVRVLLR